MGAAGNLRPDQGGLRVDYEAIRSRINERTKLITIQRSKGYATRPSFSVAGVDPVLLHGAEDLGLVVLGGAVDVREAVPEALQRRLGMGAPPFFCGAYGCDCCETQKPPPCTVTVSID